MPMQNSMSVYSSSQTEYSYLLELTPTHVRSRGDHDNPRYAPWHSLQRLGGGWMCSSVCSKAVDKQVAYCMCVGCDEQGQCVYNEPDCALRCRCNCNGRLGDVDAAAAALTMPGG
ncbi:hypothetical protein FOCC_FOCC003264 [Frankliniella occidentalis]|nr:hypothetical protein FOCC_FOCC003264 [Frankliniella occidentalis]